MKFKPTPLPFQKIALFALGLPWLFAATLLWGAPEGATKLGPAKVKQINEINKGYQDCVQATIADVKAGRIKGQGVLAAVTQCRVRYPAAALYQECKRKVLTGSGKAKPDVQELTKCRKVLEAASFEPSDSLAFFIHESKVFMGGLGLNGDVKLVDHNPPNYSCENVQIAAKSPQKAAYMLIGNFPGVFAEGEAVQAKYLQVVAKGLAGGNRNGPHIDVPGYGRLFPEAKTGGGTGRVAYFPSGSCDFNAPLGKNYAGLSLHYLIDAATSLLTPYFGVSYYAKSQRALTSKALVQAVQSQLGPGFKVFKKNASTYFVAVAPFTELDSEGDPRNLCKLPRTHQLVAVIHTFDDAPERPEYLILANVKNLCDYGDRLARRLGS